MWEDWEGWFRNLLETHTRAPVLAFVPSVHRSQTWLIAAAAILDAASLCVSGLEAGGQPSALSCHSTGVRALQLIKAQLVDRRVVGVRGSRGVGLNRTAFDGACDRLAALGVPIKADRDVCWRRFSDLRREYEILVPGLATSLLVPMDNVLLLPLDLS